MEGSGKGLAPQNFSPLDSCWCLKFNHLFVWFTKILLPIKKNVMYCSPFHACIHPPIQQILNTSSQWQEHGEQVKKEAEMKLVMHTGAGTLQAFSTLSILVFNIRATENHRMFLNRRVCDDHICVFKRWPGCLVEREWEQEWICGSQQGGCCACLEERQRWLIYCFFRRMI